MQNQPPHSALRTELRRRGLPLAYIERLVAELDDHYSDLVEERSSRMGAARKLQFEEANDHADDVRDRLGEPTQLALFAAEQYHARSFFGRHPWLTFAVGPLPLLFMGWVAFGLAVEGIAVLLAGLDYVWAWAARWSWASVPEENHPFAQAVVLALYSWTFLVIPSLLTAVVLCRVAAHNGLHWKWPTLACGMLATIAGVSWVSYKIKTIDGIGTFMVGFQANTSMYWILTSFLPKFALAMAIGLLVMKRSQERAAAVA